MTEGSSQSGEAETSTGLDTIAIIVDALRAKFGEDAFEVALRQREAAASDPDSAWFEIVERLRG